MKIDESCIDGKIVNAIEELDIPAWATESQQEKLVYVLGYIQGLIDLGNELREAFES